VIEIDKPEYAWIHINSHECAEYKLIRAHLEYLHAHYKYVYTHAPILYIHAHASVYVVICPSPYVYACARVRACLCAWERDWLFCSFVCASARVCICMCTRVYLWACCACISLVCVLACVCRRDDGVCDAAATEANEKGAHSCEFFFLLLLKKQGGLVKKMKKSGGWVSFFDYILAIGNMTCGEKSELSKHGHEACCMSEIWTYFALDFFGGCDWKNELREKEWFSKCNFESCDSTEMWKFVFLVESIVRKVGVQMWLWNLWYEWNVWYECNLITEIWLKSEMKYAIWIKSEMKCVIWVEFVIWMKSDHWR